MGAACAGTTPTTEDGGTVTFVARASNRTCMKGGEVTGIAVGDMVILSANQYAIQPGGDGTGPLGVSVWGAGKNWTASSEDFDSADWTPFGSGVAAPTVTANYALSPRNQMTAERIQAAATGVGNRSFIYQVNACSGTGIDSLSCYVRGTSGSGTTDLAWGGGAGGWDSQPCDFVSTSWTRCRLLFSTVNAATLFAVGNLSVTARAASDFLLSGCQCEAGYVASPYMPTGIGATATRDTEAPPRASFTGGSSFSLGASLVKSDPFFINATSAASIAFDAGNEFSSPVIGSKLSCDINIAGTHSTGYARENLYGTTPPEKQLSCSYASASRAACMGGTCLATSGSLTLPTGSGEIRIGGVQDGGTANGTVKLVCADGTRSDACNPSGSSLASCPYSGGNSTKVALIGDSIMVGVDTIKVADEMNDRLCLNSRAVSQYAVSGYTIADCHASYLASVKGAGFSSVATDCGTNNLLSGHAESAVDAWAEMFDLLQDITGDGGYRVVLGNVIGCTGYSGCDLTKIATFNALETLWCADAGYKAKCIDNHSTIKNATLRAPVFDEMGSLCTPSTDFLHPNSYCTVLLADSFADAVLDGGL